MEREDRGKGHREGNKRRVEKGEREREREREKDRKKKRKYVKLKRKWTILLNVGK